MGSKGIFSHHPPSLCVPFTFSPSCMIHLLSLPGSVSLQCDVDGRCACRAGVTGEKCDTCRAGFHSLGPGGCRWATRIVINTDAQTYWDRRKTNISFLCIYLDIIMFKTSHAVTSKLIVRELSLEGDWNLFLCMRVNNKCLAAQQRNIHVEEFEGWGHVTDVVTIKG